MFYLMSVLSHVQLFATRWTVAHKAPLSVKVFRQKYWSGLPFPTPGYLSDPGIETVSPALPALAGDSLPRCRLGSPHTTTTRLHFSQKAKQQLSYKDNFKSLKVIKSPLNPLKMNVSLQQRYLFLNQNIPFFLITNNIATLNF